MGWHHEWMKGMGGFMFPGFGLIIIVIFVAGIWWLAGGRFDRSFRGNSAGDHLPSETPLEILKRRYASGEISKEEYEKMKSDIQS